jgi:hypothetical protein
MSHEYGMRHTRGLMCCLYQAAAEAGDMKFAAFEGLSGSLTEKTAICELVPRMDVEKMTMHT